MNWEAITAISEIVDLVKLFRTPQLSNVFHIMVQQLFLEVIWTDVAEG